MRTMDASHVGLVIAARAGDRRARDELVAAYLPLVYNIVGHALRGHPDVDDVVQETFLRAVRDLPTVRDPNSFRSWLVAIAVHQISSHLRRHRSGGGTVADTGEEPRARHAVAGFEEAAVLRLQLSDQRRQVAEASRWLDAEHRVTASLWWQETAGEMSRREVATVLGLTVAHTAVRMQRMREQLDQGRSIVAALAAAPRCRRLAATIGDWNGDRNPLWRKRITRHVRDCAECRAATGEQIPLERLLFALAPLTVPAGLAAGIAAGIAAVELTSAAVGSTAAAQVSVLGKLLQAVLSHPAAGIATGTAVAIAGTVMYVATPEPAPRPPVAVTAPMAGKAEPVPATPDDTPASPSRPSPSESTPPNGPLVPHGSWSLESVAADGEYLTYNGDLAALALPGDEQNRQRATVTIVEGLADADCVTFRASDGRYLRHYELRLRLDADEGTDLFREDATFCPVAGATEGSVTLRAHNYPGSVLRYRDGGVHLDGSDGSETFGRESSFVVRDPLSG
ncbi:sigma-70 family RNA polymerase sigma factor [Phytomonospora sp. NPDC050363]|uniref:sigma-70 family RNA polymerase sigma factor n=1 Tax=Phytomonospora sp. NPDC050363 TaxID=3155642 RepID=UPI0033F17963